MNCNLPKEFNEGLKLLAVLSRHMAEAGAAVPVVIGASAVEVHSNGTYPAADIEVSVQDIPRCVAELARVGFHRDEPGSNKMRFWNPELWIGIQISGRVPFRGKALSARQVSFETGAGPVRVISLEDTIAELVSDFDTDPRGQREAMDRANQLYKTAGALNRPYLDLRIREETLGRTLAWFVGLSAQRVAMARWG